MKPDDDMKQYADDYVHGVLSEEEAKYFKEYCDSHPDVAKAVAEAEHRKAMLSEAPPVEAPSDLVDRTISHVEQRIQRSNANWKTFTRTFALSTTAAVLIIGVLHASYAFMTPSDYDLRLIGQTKLMPGSGASMRVGLFDVSSQTQLQGVPVEVALFDPRKNEEVTLVSYKTGDPPIKQQFKVPDWADGSYELRVLAKPQSGYVEKLTQTVTLNRQWKVMLTSDKPVYKPGQKILLRSLALRKPDLLPVAGQNVQFTVTDPKGNIVFKQSDVTSKFGIASTTCQLADELNEGAYNIDVRVGEVSSQRTVEVQKYVLPKFKIAVKIDKPFYQPGEDVTGSIQADYFFGEPVASGDVKIEVRTRDVRSRTIKTLEAETDEKGAAEFSFKLPDSLVGREGLSGDASFEMVAVVTDTAGQKYSKGASRIVTNNPIKIEIIPESGGLVKGHENKVYIYTSYPDGRPAEVSLVATGSDKPLQTNRLGVAAVSIKTDKAAIQMIVKATDKQGRAGRRQKRLICGKVTGDYLLRPDKAVYEGGETMELAAVGSGVEPVFVDLIKDDQVLLTSTLEMADGKGIASIDLPPGLAGAVQLEAYRFEKAGLAVRKSRTVFVRQASDLKITATMDKEQYRPGQQAKLKLKLTNSNGAPAPGALSLTAVDEAVFSVLNQKAGMQQIFFLLEEELLEPVYQIYNWGPGTGRGVPDAERQQFNQALFSRTAGGENDEASLDFLRGRPVASKETAREMPMVEFAAVDVAVDEDAVTPVAFRRGDRVEMTTHPAKVLAVAETRQSGLDLAATMWTLLALAVGATCYVGAVVYRPRAALISTAVVFGLVVLMSPLALIFMMATSEQFSAVGMEMAAAKAEPGMMMDGGDFADASPMEGDMAMPMMEAPMDGFGGEAETASPEEAMADDPAETAAPRVRSDFPETLFWAPEVITDDEGVATVELDLADSITTWRLSASAVTTSGELGGGEFPIKVFQPFFVDLDLPYALTRRDEVGVPMVVYNYLSKPQTVELTVRGEEWFAYLGSGDESDEAATEEAADRTFKLNLKPGEIRSMHLPIKVKNVGLHKLQVTAKGSGMSDAVEREIIVDPNGEMIEQLAGGTLDQPAEITLSAPQDAVPGSVAAFVKLYPSSFSQVVEGLENIFRMPSGCFEQTSSTTYPNVLALQYLKNAGKLNGASAAPQSVEAKARGYIHTGYQRLISFEVKGGGFDWFGNPPANVTLTAYGLMEFEDMAKVYDVDPALLVRTRNWLLSKRRGDGSWAAERGMLNDGLAGSVQRGGDLDLASTAYIGWAVFGTGSNQNQAQQTLNYLMKTPPGEIKDPYLLAVVTNAIAAIDNSNAKLPEYFRALDDLKKSSDDGKHVWWEQAPAKDTMFYGSGVSGNIETTALAAMALLNARQFPATTRGALTWLISQKDGNGTWHSTQATVLALKTLIAGTGAALGEETERKIQISLGDEVVRNITISPDQAEVMQTIDLSDMISHGGGKYQLKVAETTKTGTGYQIVFRYHLEQDEPGAEMKEPLSIGIQYDRERLNVDDTVTANATVVNNMDTTAPMVMLDLPIPGGFTIEPGELDELKGSRKISKYEITPRKAIIYLRSLEPGQEMKLRYRLKATMPVKVEAPAGEVYEYYNPAKRGKGGAAKLEAVIEA